MSHRKEESIKVNDIKEVDKMGEKESYVLIIQLLENLEARLRSAENEIDAIADEKRNASIDNFGKVKSYFNKDLEKLKKLI